MNGVFLRGRYIILQSPDTAATLSVHASGVYGIKNRGNEFLIHLKNGLLMCRARKIQKVTLQYINPWVTLFFVFELF